MVLPLACRRLTGGEPAHRSRWVAIRPEFGRRHSRSGRRHIYRTQAVPAARWRRLLPWFRQRLRRSAARQRGWQHNSGCRSVGFPEEPSIKTPFAGDFEPDGSWYSMISIGDLLFAVNRTTANWISSSRVAASSALPIFRPRKDISFPLRSPFIAVTSTWAISVCFRSQQGRRRF